MKNTNVTTAPASIASVKGLDPEIMKLFGLTMPEVSTEAPSIADQKDTLMDEVCADDPTLSEFWGRMAGANYALTPSKKLFVKAFGESNGTIYANALKAEIDRFVACLLAYEVSKRTASKKANTAQKNALFAMLNALAVRCGFDEKARFTAGQLESMATHAYRYGYVDRTDIKKGWTARPVTTWSFWAFALKEMSASNSLSKAADAASVRFVKSVKATMPKEG